MSTAFDGFYFVWFCSALWIAPSDALGIFFDARMAAKMGWIWEGSRESPEDRVSGGRQAASRGEKHRHLGEDLL